MDWVLSHLDDLASYTAAHVAQCVPAIVIGFVVSVPLGYLASRSRVARAVLLTGGNILYTIPGLALVILVPVTLGLPLLDSRNVVFALLIYAVALMVRSATDAFSSVSPEVRQSAVAQGYSPAQRFWRVELPLAGPVLLAGVRVVSVSTISLATIGALIGIQNLGTLFTDAQSRAFLLEAFVGIVLVLLLAAVFDVVLTLLGRLLMPWQAATSTRRRRRAVRAAATEGRAA
ncbi:ABC transporter permease [Amnibacterium endophyticum]|uniref:ABC transporter permease n=1 Tax=Amnibacterium endophyticum TaxID=2109337 RepID=A0ABW4LG25_9MICO